MMTLINITMYCLKIISCEYIDYMTTVYNSFLDVLCCVLVVVS